MIESVSQSVANSAPELLPAMHIVKQFDKLEVSHHPFFLQLQSYPVNLGAIWILIANLRAGISHHFVPWLARTIERIEDRRIGALLSKQLCDELGNGDFSQIHSVLLDQFVAGLAPFRPENAHAGTLSPGFRLCESNNAIFFSNDAYRAVGALMVGEIFAKKMDRALGNEIRRQNKLSREALVWLELHETLEENHADDSTELAKLIPLRGPALASTWKGANEQWRTLWQFLDGVHVEAF